MRSKVAILMASLGLAGCSQGVGEGEYAMPLDQAYALMYDADTTEFRNRWQCGLLIRFKKDGVTNDYITWRVSSRGQSVGSFTARFEETSPGVTKVNIEIPEASDGGEIYDGTKSLPRPAFRQPLRSGVEEFVASQIQGRAFSIQGMPRLKVNDPCFTQKEMLGLGQGVKVDDYDRKQTWSDAPAGGFDEGGWGS